MQAASDIFLGWHRSQLGPGSTPYDFYIRQLRDWKASADIATMTPAAMRAYGQLCGWTLARAHAWSGDRIAIAAYLGRSAVSTRRSGGVRRGLRRPERARLPRPSPCGPSRARGCQARRLRPESGASRLWPAGLTGCGGRAAVLTRAGGAGGPAWCPATSCRRRRSVARRAGRPRPRARRAGAGWPRRAGRRPSRSFVPGGPGRAAAARAGRRRPR